jgi:hypothetical protein
MRNFWLREEAVILEAAVFKSLSIFSALGNSSNHNHGYVDFWPNKFVNLEPLGKPKSFDWVVQVFFMYRHVIA